MAEREADPSWMELVRPEREYQLVQMALERELWCPGMMGFESREDAEAFLLYLDSLTPDERAQRFLDNVERELQRRATVET